MTRVSKERQVPATIESGFTALRQARGKTINRVSGRLADVSQGHEDVDIRWPYVTARSRATTGINLLATTTVRINSAALGHLMRAEVYDGLEGLALLNESRRVTAIKLKPATGSDGRVPAGTHKISVGFDEKSEENLRQQNNAITKHLAALAGVPHSTLVLPDYTPELVLAYVPQHVPVEIVETMRSTLQTELLPFEFGLKGLRLLPRLPDDQRQPV